MPRLRQNPASNMLRRVSLRWLAPSKRSDGREFRGRGPAESPGRQPALLTNQRFERGQSEEPRWANVALREGGSPSQRAVEGGQVLGARWRVCRALPPELARCIPSRRIGWGWWPLRRPALCGRTGSPTVAHRAAGRRCGTFCRSPVPAAFRCSQDEIRGGALSGG